MQPFDSVDKHRTRAAVSGNEFLRTHGVYQGEEVFWYTRTIEETKAASPYVQFYTSKKLATETTDHQRRRPEINDSLNERLVRTRSSALNCAYENIVRI